MGKCSVSTEILQTLQHRTKKLVFVVFNVRFTVDWLAFDHLFDRKDTQLPTLFQGLVTFSLNSPCPNPNGPLRLSLFTTDSLPRPGGTQEEHICTNQEEMKGLNRKGPA